MWLCMGVGYAIMDVHLRRGSSRHCGRTVNTEDAPIR
jgi:hypothetical protein